MSPIANPLRIMPPVTKALITINLIVWLFMFVAPSSFDATMMHYCGLHYFSAPYFNPAQLFTYMFMHSTGGLAHIFFNMFALFMFGMSIENALGGKRFLFYYVSCGIGAALMQEVVWALTWERTLIDALAPVTPGTLEQLRAEIATAAAGGPGHEVIAQFLNNGFVTIGASGAVYGILLAFGMIFPDRPIYLMFIPIPIKAKWMVIGYGVLELLIGLSEARGATDGVAHFAHLGGMIFGFLMILYWKKKGLFNHGNGYY